MKLSVKLLTLLVLCIVFDFPVAAQTLTDLQKILGVPPEKEIYRISARVWAIARYGADEQLCRVVVREKYSLSNAASTFGAPDGDQPIEKSASAIYSDIINNLSPPLRFGKLIKDGESLTGNCFSSGATEYENTIVSRSSQSCGSDFALRSYAIEWKRQACKSVGQ